MNKNKKKINIVDSSISSKESDNSTERSKAELNVPDPKPEQAAAALDKNGEKLNKYEPISAYFKAYNQMVQAQPGTEEFNQKLKEVELLWNQLSIDEQSLAYSKVAPLRKRLKGL
jgi:hypothetical protein